MLRTKIYTSINTIRMILLDNDTCMGLGFEKFLSLKYCSRYGQWAERDGARYSNDTMGLYATQIKDLFRTCMYVCMNVFMYVRTYSIASKYICAMRANSVVRRCEGMY